MLKIINGRVYDPANGKNGQVEDLWVKDGKIVSAPADDRLPAQIIDASGLVIMAGGVDIHSHAVGAKVNAARKLRPEDHYGSTFERTSRTRSGSGFTVPSTYITGYLYAKMGYTTVMEAATAPLVARHTHEELEDIPILDMGAFITMGNNHFIMECIRDGEMEKAKDYVAWLLNATKGYAIKVVNPGGVENWKWGRNVQELNDEVIGFGVTPHQIVTTLAWISDELGLPHPPHIHGINLGRSISARTTMETMAALEGRRSHFCHLQFLSYGKQPGRLHRSEAAEVARMVNSQPNLTVDVGQIVFGPATTMTSDAPLQYRIHQETGNKWINDDLENETGGGIVPINYSRHNAINSVMWRTGLELFLLIDDPWQVLLTTDHPNAGPFVYYPQVIKLLMDRDYRAAMFERTNHRGRKDALLPELKREYSLYEIAIITRAGTARALGLKNKGHLGVGADADITIYADHDDKEEMFAQPRYVLKGGEVVVVDGQIMREVKGKTLYVAPAYDPGIEAHIQQHFRENYTVSFDNYPISREHFPHREMIHCP
jgi:formylmethanofuran dehydrogenase subunit A